MLTSAPLFLSRFRLLLGLSFQLSGMVKDDRMVEMKRNLSLARYLSARKTYMYRKKDISKLAELTAALTASLFNLVCVEVDVLILHLYHETMNKILYFIISSLFH